MAFPRSTTSLRTHPEGRARRPRRAAKHSNQPQQFPKQNVACNVFFRTEEQNVVNDVRSHRPTNLLFRSLKRLSGISEVTEIRTGPAFIFLRSEDAEDAIDQQREERFGRIEKQLKQISEVRNLFAI